jgi:hypothetical protein
VPRSYETAKVIKSVYLTIPVCNRVEEEARKRGKSFSALVEEAVLLYLYLLENEGKSPFLKELLGAVRERRAALELAPYATASKEREVESGG